MSPVKLRSQSLLKEEMECRRVADLLLLLSGSRRDDDGPTAAPAAAGRDFECKTCARRFTTFQALGGHRTSCHKRPRAEGGGQLGIQRERPTARLHECTTCGAAFPTGQALGGHMRRHKLAAALTPTHPEKKKLVGPAAEKVLWLDLNKPPLEK